MADTRKIGFDKEKEAGKFLKKNGFKILDKNYRTPYGEIDIVAKEKKVLVFVEVKYRKTSLFGTPQEAVNFKKQQKIIKSAIIYMKEKNISRDYRFDIVSICADKCEIIKSAFAAEAGEYYI